MKKTGIVICMLAALVGLAGCSSVISSDRAKSGIDSQGKFKVNTPDEAADSLFSTWGLEVEVHEW